MTDRAGECWLWLGHRTRDGYGMVTVEKRPRLAHRVSYEVHVGEIPVGLQLDHLCRVTACINPSHLEPVTASENMLRAWAAVEGSNRPRKTECVAGHPYTEENTYLDKGFRYCRECKRERSRAYNRKVRAAKPRQRSYTNHAEVAASLKARPGEWLLVSAPDSRDTAYHTASYIRSAKRLPAYSPAGSFDAEIRTVDGATQVYARFVGESGGAS
jgi:hypothetical protein